jgi:hypothetical protein
MGRKGERANLTGAPRGTDPTLAFGSEPIARIVDLHSVPGHSIGRARGFGRLLEELRHLGRHQHHSECWEHPLLSSSREQASVIITCGIADIELHDLPAAVNSRHTLSLHLVREAVVVGDGLAGCHNEVVDRRWAFA